MRQKLVRALLALATVLPLAIPAMAVGQVATREVRTADVRTIAATLDPLLRPVTVDATDMPLGAVLTSIAAQAKLGLVYNSDSIPVDQAVTLRLENAPAGEALQLALAGLGVDFSLNRNTQVVLSRRPAAKASGSTRAAQQTGTISGRITDADTGEGIAAADVWLDGTKHRVVTNPEGRFLLSGVEPRTYTLRVRRIGYTAASQTVTVVANQTATADVALKNAPTQLDAVIVTVTGEQRLRELGHVVGRINADSLVREAPVSSITELLTSRVPGLLVQTDGGTVGGDVTLKIRTTNSLWLNPEPIVIVDGVRYTTNPRSGATQRFGAGWNTAQLSPFQNEGTSRLNDLNPNDIESIEVVKGPSAATLYGTDAANGVIVITTKQGRPGPARWNLYGRASMSEIATQRYPDIYWGWGSSASSCTLDRVATGACTQDSVSIIKNPLNDPELTIFGSKPRWEYGTNVSGGSESLRYYFSADLEEAIGPVRLPYSLVEAIKQKRGVKELPKELLEPNAFNKINLRSTLNAHLGRSTNLRASAGYTQSATRTLVNSNPYTGAQLASPDDHYSPASDPENAFSQTSTENVNRFFGSVGGDSRLLSWLQVRANLGIDHISSNRYSLARPGEAPKTTNAAGVVGDNRTRYLVTSGDLGATANYEIGGGLTGRTAVGAQYVRNLHDALSSTGRGLAPGGASIGAAATVTTTQLYNETVTLGSYLEQLIGINDRLFLTGALRIDGASGFGRDYETAVYPKAGASWIISDESNTLPYLPWLNDLRLRYAFGASGQQARPEWTSPVFKVSQYTVDGLAGNTVGIITLGNPDLRPERIREHELGLDASAFDNRLALDLTWNWRRSADGIQPLPLAPGFGTFGGSAMIWTNVGLIEAHGFEARLNGRVVETPTTSLDVSYSYAWHTDKLIDLGGRPAEKRADNPGWAEGYPLGALFGRKLLSYEDKNGDGLIDRNEVVLSSAHLDSLEYLGRSIPPQTQTLVTTVGLFEQRLRISALLDRQTGFYRVNSQWMQMCGTAARCRSLVDPSTSLEEQAQSAAFIAAGRSALRYSRLERGDFTRLREVSLTAVMPQNWARTARVNNASVSLSARNLGLWTDFGGDDPESRSGRIPQARAWTVRVDLGL